MESLGLIVKLQISAMFFLFVISKCDLHFDLNKKKKKKERERERNNTFNLISPVVMLFAFVDKLIHRSYCGYHSYVYCVFPVCFFGR